MSRVQSGFERLVGRVRDGVEGKRPSFVSKRAFSSAPRKKRMSLDPVRQLPYLEPLEPRILLSADVGLVPEALVAPIGDDLDPRLLLQPEVHDELLVREPSKFEHITRDVFTRINSDTLELDVVSTREEVVSLEVDVAADDAVASGEDEATVASPEDPDAAARALRSRVWSAELIEQLAQSEPAQQVVVVDARIPDVDSLLNALLEGVGESDASDGATATLSDGDAGANGSDHDGAVAGGGEAGAEAQGAASLLDDDSILNGSSKATATDAESLAAALEARGISVVVLDSERDGLDQLAEIARAYQGVGAMHVVSHGARGSLTLGNSRVTTETLRARAGTLAGLRDALGEDGDLLLYGCNVAGGEVGIEFVSTLAEMGGIDVAASTDLTGAESFGGDWDLEFTTGEIEAAAIRAEAFESVLAAFTLVDTSEASEITLSFDSGASEWVLSSNQTLNDGTTDANEFNFTLTAGEGITITGGDGDDTLTIASVDGSTETISLVGGAGDDLIRVGPDAASTAADRISIDGGDGTADTIELGAFDAADLVGDAASNVEFEIPADLTALAVSAEAVRDFAQAIRDLANDADTLASNGNFAAQLAGLFGNVDVTLGGAMDLGEVFTQLAVEIEAQAASITNAAELEQVLSTLMRSDITHFDRVLEGAVVGTAADIEGPLGFTIQLDNGDVFRFGRAADSMGTTPTFGVAVPSSVGSIEARREANGDGTLTISDGSWEDHGFRSGLTIVFDEGGDERSFAIASISGDGRVLTLEEEDVAPFDAIIGRDTADPDSDPAARTFSIDGSTYNFRVENTIVAIEGDDSFTELGFRKGQQIVVLDSAGATVETLTIDAISEDGRVIRYEPSATDLSSATRIVGSALPTSGAVGLVDLRDQINAQIDKSELEGRVRAVVLDLDSSGAATATSRLGFQVVDTEVDELAFQLTLAPSAGSIGFDVTTDPAELTGLAGELSGLGELSASVGGPSYEVETFKPELVGFNTLTIDGVTDAGSTETVTFKPGSDGQGVLSRSVGPWSGFTVDQEITITAGGVVDGSFNHGTFKIISGETSSDLVVVRVLTVTDSGTQKVVSREQGSWLEEGFRTGQEISIGDDVTATVDVASESSLTVTVTAGTLDAGSSTESIAVAEGDRVLVRKAIGSDALRIDFNYDAERESNFNLDLGALAEEKGIVFGSDVSLTLETSLSSQLSFTIASPDVADDGDAGIATDVTALSLSANVNTPETDISLLPSGGANSDLADALFSRNVDQGAASNIGFLGAEVSDGDGTTDMDGFVSIYAGLEFDSTLGAWDSDASYTNESFLAADIPIVVSDGLPGLTASGLRISTLSPDPLDPFDPVLVEGSVFEGRDAFADERIFRGLTEDIGGGFTVEEFANMDASGFLRLLSEIRTGLQRVNDSDIISQFDIPFVEEALGGLTDLANTFGNLILFDEGDDGRDGADALASDVNSAFEAAGLGDQIGFEAFSEDGDQKFRIYAKDLSITGIDLDGAFFGINGTGDDRREGAAVPAPGETGALYDAMGVLAAEQTVNITLRRGSVSADAVEVKVEVASTTDNEKVGNDQSKLLNADNSPTFSTAQELAKKLIDLAIDGTGLQDNLTFDDGILLFKFDTAYELFEEEFAIDFDLDLDPLGEIQTVGDPMLQIGGEIGFSIEFGIDLRNDIPGRSGISEDTLLEDLNGVDMIGDLIEDRPSITGRFVPGETVINDPAPPEDPAVTEPEFEVSLDRIQMDPGTTITIESGSSPRITSETLIGNRIFLNAPSGSDIRIAQRETTGDDTSNFEFTGERFTQRPLNLPPTSGPILDGGVDAFDFYVAVYGENDLVAATFPGDIDPATESPSDSRWVYVSVDAWTPPTEGSSSAKRRDFQAHLEQAIANAQTAGTEDAIHRDSGTWGDDGFAVGQMIQISRAGSNNGLYVIEEIRDEGGTSTMVLSGTLTEMVTSSAQIQGVGTITLAQIDNGAGTVDPADLLADFGVGDAIQISGSLRNDGNYLVIENRGDSLVIDSALSREAASSDIELTGNGGSVRLSAPPQAVLDDPDGMTGTTPNAEIIDDANARFDVEVDGETYSIVVFREQQEDDAFAPFAADNRSPSDLVQDFRSALTRAIVTSTAGTANETVVDISDRVDVGLDGAKLVLTMAVQKLEGSDTLEFVDTGDTITRVAASEGSDPGSWVADGFRVGDIIRVGEDGDRGNAGIYRVTAIGDAVADTEFNDQLTVVRLDGGASSVASEELRVERILGTLRGDATLTVGAGADSITRSEGSFLEDGFVEGQLVVIEGAGADNGTYRVAVGGVSDLLLTLEATRVAPGTDVTFSADSSSTGGPLVATTFRILNVNGGAQELGFGTAAEAAETDGVAAVEDHYASLYDLALFVGDTEYLVSLDGASTVGEVMRRIEEAAGATYDVDGNQLTGAINARINDDGTAIELLTRGQMNGRPRLTFEASTATDAGSIERSTGSFKEDGFAVGDAITVSDSGMDANNGTWTIASISDDGRTLTFAVGVGNGPGQAQEFVRDAKVVVGTSAAASRSAFRVEFINGSVAAAGLGILAADATGDENEDGTVGALDRDGIIEGTAIGGASLLDRIFIENPEITVDLSLEVVDEDTTDTDPGAVDVDARFGFVEAELRGTGEFNAQGTFALNDPTEDDGPGGRDLITLRDIVDGIRNPSDFISTPEFGGGAEVEDLAGIALTNIDDPQSTDPADMVGQIRYTNTPLGSFTDDGFGVGDYVTISNFVDGDGDSPDGTYRITNISTDGSTMRLDSAFEGDLSATPTANFAIFRPVGLFNLTVESLGVESLGNITREQLLGLSDEADPKVTLTLVDFGDPFFRESLGADTDNGGDVALAALDMLTITATAVNSDLDEVNDILSDVSSALGEQDEVRVTVVYVDKDGEEQDETRVVKAYDATGKVVTLEEDLVDDASDVREIKSIQFTKPPKTEIETPDLGNLLDFSNLSIRDIIRGLQMASDFLGQFEEFAFLDAALPPVGVSLNDVLDFADQLAAGLEEVENDPDGTLQTVETRLEEALGITPDDPFDIDLSIVTEDAGAGIFHQVLKVDLILGDSFQETFGVEFDLGDLGADFADGTLAGSADVTASGAAQVAISFGIDITETLMRGEPALTFAETDARTGTITRDAGSWTMDRFLVGQSIKVMETTDRDGRYVITDIDETGMVLTVQRAETEDVGGEDLAVALGWGATTAPLAGLEISGARSVSLFDSTGVTATFVGEATDLDFRAAVGPLGIYIQEGVVRVSGASSGGNDEVFSAGLDFDGQDRMIASEALGSLSELFVVEMAAAIEFDLPVYFPTDGQLQGGIILTPTTLSLEVAPLDADPESQADFAFTPGSVLFYTGSDRAGATDDPTQLFTLPDPSELSLFDNIRLAVDGFDMILGGIQDVLDGEILGIDLPLIGDSLADGARFIEDLREDFVEPFRDGLDDAESFVDDVSDANKNIISQLLFDELSKTGLLLVTHFGDEALDETFAARGNKLVSEAEFEELYGDMTRAEYESIAVEERVFVLSQVVRLNGTRRDENDNYFDSREDTTSEGEIDIAGIPTGVLKDVAFLEWDFRLGQNFSAVDADIALDFGVPAIGLEADGALGVELAWDLELGFGLDFESGFYFDIGSSSELEVDVDVVLPDSLTGRLAFLQLEAENLGSGLGASFAVDLVNKSDATDDRLAFTELGKLSLEAGISAEANALLDLELKLNDELLEDFANVFPSVLAEFHFNWGIGSRDLTGLDFDGNTISSSDVDFGAVGYAEGQTIRVSGTGDSTYDGAYTISSVAGGTIVVSGTPGWTGDASGIDFRFFRDIRDIDGSVVSEGLHLVQFQNVNLDLGSFISDFAKPILSEIQKVTGPIQPIVDILTSPLPVVSDLGPPVTLLDLARISGTFNPALIEAIADIITLVNAIPTNVDTVMIPFGSFTIFDRSMVGQDGMSVDPTDPNADLSGLSETQGEMTPEPAAPSQQNETTSFVDKLRNTRGFQFPILSDPTQIFGLLTGQEVVLFGYDMPAFELDLSYTAFFPFYGPLGIGLTGTATAKIDFAFGFDSSGLQRFLDSGFTNPEVIFDGFFVSDNPEDVTGAGPDGDELAFSLGFYLSAELNLGVARAGVAGGINASVEFDLFDPNRDGKIRVGEIIENIENEFLFGEPLIAPLAIFDVDGRVTARAFAFLKIDLLLFEIDKEFPITPTITLVDFSIDFTRAPKLGTVLEDGTLQLNMGEYAGERLNDDLRDLGENFRVESRGNDLRVTWVGSNGSGPDFYNDFDASDITGILAFAGEGNDIIDLSMISAAHRAGMRYEVDGGSGNDRIIAGTVGSATDASSDPLTAILRGGDGNDQIVGTVGADQIYGGAGSDRIFGGGGDDVIFGDFERLVEKQPRARNMTVEAQLAGNGLSFELTDTDPDRDFLVDGFEAGQTVVLTVARDTGGAELEEVEAIFQIATGGVTATTLTLESVTSGEAVSLPSLIEGDLVEVAAQDAEFLAAYKSTAGESDAADAIVGGIGNDWIFGAGGDDILIGGADGDIAPSLDPNAGLTRLGNYLNRSLTVSASGTATTDASGNDVILGDGGELRLMRDGTIREIDGTDRGLAFGNDAIFGSGGADQLYAGRGDDLVHGGSGGDTIFGETGSDTIHAEAGVDHVYGGRDGDTITGGDNDDFLFGEQGADTIHGDNGDGTGLGNDEIYGGAGADALFGEAGEDTIRGGSDNDTIDGGTEGDDLFGEAGDDHVLGGDGADDIEIRGGNDVVDGQSGGDSVFVKFKGGENTGLFTIYDSGTAADGVDSLRIVGTAGDDQFLMRTSRRVEDLSDDIGFVASIVQDQIAASRPDDPTERFFVERADYDGIEDLVVDGGYGDDRFALDDTHETATTLFGGGGDDFFQVGQLYRSQRTAADANIAERDVFETVETTRGFLSHGISNAATINAGNDNDTIVVYRNLGVLTVNGNAGDDTIEVRAFALVNDSDEEQAETTIAGGGGVDTIRYAVNAPVNIDGGEGTDTVSIIGTEFGDEFVITRDGVFGAGLNVNFVNVELLRVDGAEGDDRFYVQSTNENVLTQVFGGLGTDTIQVADGEQHAVTSNDLLGYSGLILHDVESTDPAYQGPTEAADGIRVDGISANIRDDDEAGLLITQIGGFLRINESETGVRRYEVVLTRDPGANRKVIVTASAPNLSEEAIARGEALFGLRLDAAPGDEGLRGVQLEFDSTNWDQAQNIYINLNLDDAIEGERFGVIQHVVKVVDTSNNDAQDTANPYHGLQIPTVTVQVDDTDIADLLIGEVDDIRVYETDSGADVDQIEGSYSLNLGRNPRGGSSVEVTATVADPGASQIELSTDGVTWSSGSVSVVFTSNAAEQTIFVRGAADDVREGFHRGLIQHEVTSATAAEGDLFPDAANTEGTLPEGAVVDPTGEVVRLGVGIDATDTLLLTTTPVQFRGEANVAPPGSPDPDTTISGFDDVDFTIAELVGALGTGDLVVRITNGTGAGQIRAVSSASGNTLTVSEAWETNPDETSRFSVSGVKVFVNETGVEGGEVELDPSRFDVNGSSLVFFDEDFAVEERSFGYTRVTYRSADPGYRDLIDERIAIQVLDEDTAAVVIVESNGRTDLVEGASDPTGAEEGRIYDRYTITLSSRPAPGTTVTVFVDPAPTETSNVATDEIQLRVRRPGDAASTGSATELQFTGPGDTGRAFFVFDEDNWNESRTVEVVAIQDSVVEGQETQVFAPRLRTLTEIRGPLLVDGAGGRGSLDGLGAPVLLPSQDGSLQEQNLKAPDGDIIDLVDGPGEGQLSFVVDKLELNDALGITAADVGSLVNRTLEIVRGEGIDQFRLIEDVVDNGATYSIVVSDKLANPRWTLDTSLVNNNGDNVSAYKVTDQSLNFFVDEVDQFDAIFIHDEDSPADSHGEMIALDFDQYPSMETLFEGSLTSTNRLTGFGMGPDTLIARQLRPGGITYANFEGFELDLGYGDNTLFVDSVYERSDDVQTYTRIRSGRGDDTINVSLQNEENANGLTPWVEIDAGIGDDRVDASETNDANGVASTIDLDIIGGLGRDTLIGGTGDDLIYGDFGTTDYDGFDPTAYNEAENQADREARLREERFIDETVRIGDGDDDTIEGRRGNDRLFGGAGDDTVRGQRGEDVVFGDYGKVTDLDASTSVIETTEFFEGGADVVDGGRGNDFIFGSAGGDVLIGNLADDLLVGEYARLFVENGVATSVIRFGQGDLDVAASTFFGIYDPRFGPFAAFFLPEQVGASEDLVSRPPVSLDSSERDSGRRGLPGSTLAREYEVVEGDTLWDIADVELSDAYRWTEIHNMSRDRVADPDLIEPGQRLRIPGLRPVTPEQRQEQQIEVAAMRERLEDLDASLAQQSAAPWGFFNPLAVGAGPPGEGETQPESVPEAAPAVQPERNEEATGDGAMQIENDLKDEASDADPDLSGVILSSLVGWKANANPASARARGRWMRFDADAGRFA